MTKGDFGKVTLALTRRGRMRGLLGKQAFDGVLVLAPCNDVHTFGMLMSIDVAFVDKHGLVTRSDRDVGPGRRLRCKKAVAVLERQANGAAPWPDIGERAEIGFVSQGEPETCNRKEES